MVAAKRPYRFALVILAALALAGCAVREPAAPLPPFDGADFLTFLTPRPLLPFRATGSLVLTYRGERETGEMEVAGGRDGAYLVELRAPLTGALILRLHFDEARLMVLDFGQKTWFRGDNTPENRRRLLAVDISPEEFQVLATGRFPRPRFARWAGTITAEGMAAVTVGPVVVGGRDTPTIVEGVGVEKIADAVQMDVLAASPNSETGELYLRYRVRRG